MIRALLSDFGRVLRNRHRTLAEPIADRDVLIGYATSGHDPAVALVDGDAIFAEAFERHMECKRAHEALGVHYSKQALARGLRMLGGGPPERARFTFRTTWSFDVPALLRRATALSMFPAEWLRRSQMQLTMASHYLYTAAFQATAPTYARELACALRADVDVELAPLPRVMPLDHHLAHAANAVVTFARSRRNARGTASACSMSA